MESLFAQTGSAPYEIIVVDNGSADDTERQIRALAQVAPVPLRYLREREGGASAARNAGAAASRGDIVAFLDDDEIADPGWLAALLKTYRDHTDAWCVGGKILLALPPRLPSWFNRSSRYLTGCLSGLDLGDETIKRQYPDDVWGGNFSLRREVLRRTGGFDVTLGPRAGRHLVCEETDLCWRIQAAGGTIYYCGRAIVTHVVPETRMTRHFFREREYLQGRSQWLLDQKAPRGLGGSVRVGGPGSQRSRTHVEVFEDELRCWRALGYAAASRLAARPVDD